jgi:hypothetical protein
MISPQVIIEAAGALCGLAIFLYGILSMRGGVRDFKDAVQLLSGKLDHWIEAFGNETDSLKSRMTRAETRCEERTRLGICKYPDSEEKKDA